MKGQPHRLPADVRHGFGGSAIDRSKPLTFRLNGRTFSAFEGDTILSALLAAGVDSAGTHMGEAIRIGERFSPPVAPVRESRDPRQAMPMDRLPAMAGLDLVTLGPRLEPVRLGGVAARLAGLVMPVPRSLGHRLDDVRAFEGPWLQLAAERTTEADTIVVGGGIAGMSAAVAAAEAGGRVLLVERQRALGGDARFYGTVGDEASPEAIIDELTATIAAGPEITLLLGTDAFQLVGTTIVAHQVAVTEGRVESRVLALKAPRIVLATGSAERLPVFPGNRMPGVIGAIAAFHRAERYGVWPGARALFATPHNFAYRLALLAADAGIEVQRVVDSRIAPQSRFIDFCKASGVTLGSGLVPRQVTSLRREKGAISVAFAVAVEGADRDVDAIATDLLVAAGGWQPRLALWLMGGGRSAYDHKRSALVAEGEVEGIALAGAAAGLTSSTACLASGKAAVARLFGKRAKPVEDIAVDAVYETPSHPTSIAPWRAGRTDAFLDGGISFHTRQPPSQGPAEVSQLESIGLADVAAAVELGTIPAGDAGAVAEERCLGGGDIADIGWRLPPDGAGDKAAVPPYLAGRYGPKPVFAVFLARDERLIEPGTLFFSSSDESDPLQAIGSAFGPAPQGKPGVLAVCGRSALAAAAALFVRDTSGPVSVTLVEKLKPEEIA